MRQIIPGVLFICGLLMVVGGGHGQDKAKAKTAILARIEAVSKEKVSFMLAKPKKDGKRLYVIYFNKTKVEVHDEEGIKVHPTKFSDKLLPERPVFLQIENGGDEREPKKPMPPKRVIIFLKDKD